MIVVAFDPGTTLTGWCRVDVRGSRPLPITITFAGGGTVDSQFAAVMSLLAGADVVAIEKIEGIAYAAKGAGIVAALVASSAVAGGIAWMARRERFHVEEMTARAWRGLVLGRPQASDQQIAAVVPGLVHGFPKPRAPGNNVHVRDAAGLAVAVAWKLGGETRRIA